MVDTKKVLLGETTPGKSEILLFQKLGTGVSTKIIQQRVSPKWCTAEKVISTKNVSLGEMTPEILIFSVLEIRHRGVRYTDYLIAKCALLVIHNYKKYKVQSVYERYLSVELL
jgi:hypothetical protein